MRHWLLIFKVYAVYKVSVPTNISADISVDISDFNLVW